MSFPSTAHLMHLWETDRSQQYQVRSSEQLSSFQIDLDRPDSRFLPGETLTGNVVVMMRGDAVVKRAVLDILGKARVAQPHANEETFLTNRLTLGDGKLEAFTLTKGMNEFRFNFPLPSLLPYSFEDAAGNVKYTLKATINWINDSHDTQARAFQVRPDLDLNLEPALVSPVRTTKEFRLSSWRNNAGSIVASMSIPRGGFVRNDTIPIEIKLINNSRRDVKFTAVQLVQRVSCLKSASSLHSSDFRVDAEVTGRSSVKAGATASWIEDRLRIASTLPISLRGSAIIDLSYFVVLIIKPSGLHKRFRLSAPITIGTIPLASTTHGSNAVTFDLGR